MHHSYTLLLSVLCCISLQATALHYIKPPEQLLGGRILKKFTKMKRDRQRIVVCFHVASQ